MKMSTFAVSVLVAAASVAHSQDNAHSLGKLEVVSSGRVLSLDDEHKERVKFWLQQLMLSALYRDVIQDSSLEEWQPGLASQSRINRVDPWVLQKLVNEAGLPPYPNLSAVERNLF